jgi:hypothetical protein
VRFFAHCQRSVVCRVVSVRSTAYSCFAVCPRETSRQTCSKFPRPSLGHPGSILFRSKFCHEHVQTQMVQGSLSCHHCQLRPITNTQPRVGSNARLPRSHPELVERSELEQSQRCQGRLGKRWETGVITIRGSRAPNGSREERTARSPERRQNPSRTEKTQPNASSRVGS